VLYPVLTYSFNITPDIINKANSPLLVKLRTWWLVEFGNGFFLWGANKKKHYLEDGVM